jgi:crotonobetainyl-CoA:carnitine CoA-transferase CaiB-like acyl-CoA transferase
MAGALDGLLVVSVEQAVAAPYCAARLADAGARVIKIERPEGDFARGYDGYVHGQSSYFVWLNRGKQSLTLDFKAQGRPRFAASADRQGRRADPEPGAGRGRARGLRLRRHGGPRTRS